MIIKSLGLHHPFFQPLIRRVLTVAAIAVWGVVEVIFGHIGWAVFALCLGAVCLVAFFITFKPHKQGGDDA